MNSMRTPDGPSRSPGGRRDDVVSPLTDRFPPPGSGTTRLVRGLAVVVLVAALSGCALTPPPPPPKTSSSSSAASSVLGSPSPSTSSTGNAAGGSAASLPARLRVSGDEIDDPAGDPIVLRGYNWGQWGTAEVGDAAANSSQGANSVRIPLRWWGQWKAGADSYDPSAPGFIDPAHLAELDRTIGWAVQQHLWVDLFVDSNNGQGANGSTDNFWTDSTMRSRFLQMWAFLAARYKQTPHMGMLELLPEPRAKGVSDTQVNAFYASLIHVVRKVDTRTPLVIGPNDAYSSAHLDAAYTRTDSNIIYTADYFIFDNPTNKLKQIEAFRAKYHAPVWVNQVGIPSGKADSESKATEVLDDLIHAHIGWAWWTYRDTGTKATGEGIYYHSATGTWTEKTDWLNLLGHALSLSQPQDPTRLP